MPNNHDILLASFINFYFVIKKPSKKSAKKSKKDSLKSPEKPSEEEEATPSNEKVSMRTLLSAFWQLICVAHYNILFFDQ